jgi:hypothetical protein
MPRSLGCCSSVGATPTTTTGARDDDDGGLRVVLLRLCFVRRTLVLTMQLTFLKTHLPRSSRSSRSRARRRSRTTSVSELYLGAQSMASEESSEMRQGIQERLHAAGDGVADEAEAPAQHRDSLLPWPVSLGGFLEWQGFLVWAVCSS